MVAPTDRQETPCVLEGYGLMNSAWAAALTAAGIAVAVVLGGFAILNSNTNARIDDVNRNIDRTRAGLEAQIIYSQQRIMGVERWARDHQLKANH